MNIRIPMRIRISSNKGFSLVEMLITIGIIGVLAVIVFNAFSGVLVNSKKNTDLNISKVIERAILTYIYQSDDTNLSYLLSSTNTSPASTGCFSNNNDAEKIISFLQTKFTYQENGKNISYGPYLGGFKEKPNFSNFATQYEKHGGYEIILTPSHSNVNVNLTSKNIKSKLVIVQN